MKKVVFLALLILLVPLALQAEGALGVATYYRQPVWFDDPPDFSGASVGDFMFGLDGRLKFSILQLEALGLVTPASDVLFDGYLLGGLVLDLKVIRLYAEVGPHLGYNFASQDMSSAFSGKAGLDLVLGGASIGLSYLTDLDLKNGLDLGRDKGYLGVSLLFGW